MAKKKAEHSIRIKSSTLYEIEVNDKGEKIGIDTSDTRLVLNIDNMIYKVDKLSRDIKAKELLFDKKIKNDKKEKNRLLSKSERDLYEGIDELYDKARVEVDKVLGKNACQKIFGDGNYHMMFTDLFEALKPHFEVMGITNKKYTQEIINKYSNMDDEEL